MTQTVNAETTQNVTASIEAIRALPETHGFQQRCWVQIEEDGQLSYATQHQGENGTAMWLWHGRARTVSLPSGAIPAKVAAFLTQYRELVECVVMGMDSEWDGNNTVGTLTEGAGEALARLEALGSSEVSEGGWFDYEAGDILGSWEASDWLGGLEGDIEKHETVEAAEAFALAHAGNGEPMDDPNTGSARILVDADDARRYARRAWEAFHDEDAA